VCTRADGGVTSVGGQASAVRAQRACGTSAEGNWRRFRRHARPGLGWGGGGRGGWSLQIDMVWCTVYRVLTLAVYVQQWAWAQASKALKPEPILVLTSHSILSTITDHTCVLPLPTAASIVPEDHHHCEPLAHQTAMGVKKQVLREGNKADMPKKHDEVSIQYTGMQHTTTWTGQPSHQPPRLAL